MFTIFFSFNSIIRFIDGLSLATKEEGKKRSWNKSENHEKQT